MSILSKSVNVSHLFFPTIIEILYVYMLATVVKRINTFYKAAK